VVRDVNGNPLESALPFRDPVIRFWDYTLQNLPSERTRDVGRNQVIAVSFRKGSSPLPWIYLKRPRKSFLEVIEAAAVAPAKINSKGL